MAKPSVWEELPEPEIRDANYVYPSVGYDLNAYDDGTRLDYAGETEYGGKTYHKFVYTYIDEESGERVTDEGYAMFASRNFSKFAYPFAEALCTHSENPGEDDVYPLSKDFGEATLLYGFAEVPEDDHNTVVIERRSDTPSTNPDSYVDLGLPSGTMWAKKNVGAESEEDQGYYLAWGETEPRGNDWRTSAPYDWEHAPFNSGASTFDSGHFSTVSATVCPQGVLAPEYDAARANMGDGWRMPTVAQVYELVKATNQYTGTVGSVLGMFFVNRKDDSKRIFMPFAGYRNDNRVEEVGYYGFAWSSSLNAGDAYHSRSLEFSDSANAGNNGRYNGFVVRGVC